jgi:hypothetical protein
MAYLIGRRLVRVGVLTAFLGGVGWLAISLSLCWPTRYPAHVRLVYRLDDARAAEGAKVVDALRRCLWHEPADCRVRICDERTVEVRFGTDPKKWDALRDELAGAHVELGDLLKEMADVVVNAGDEATPAQSDVNRVTTLADKSREMTAKASRLLLASHLRRVADVRAIVERGSGLAFRVLAERSAVGDQAAILLSELEKDGPRQAGPYTWCELVDPELAGRADLVTGQHDGQPFVLACAMPELTMLQDRSQPSWRVERAGPGLGFDDAWTVEFLLDAAGGRQLEALTSRVINRPLGIVVGGRVYMAPTVTGTLGAYGQISGGFGYSDCVRLAGYLLAPAEPLGLQAGPIQEPEVNEPLWIWPEIPFHVVGGPVLIAGAVAVWLAMRRRPAHRAGPESATTN